MPAALEGLALDLAFDVKPENRTVARELERCPLISSACPRGFALAGVLAAIGVAGVLTLGPASPGRC